MPAPIYTGGTLTRDDLALEEMTAPLGQAVGAAAEDAWRRGATRAPFAITESYRQLEGDKPSADELLTGNFSTLDAPTPPTPYISAEQARAKVKAAGVKVDLPDGPVPEGYVDFQIKNKTDEVARQDVIARMPKGFWPAAAVMGAGVGVSLLDPVNVASAFIPIIGEARFASMAGSMGLTGARLAKGVAEGGVGTAMLEPLVLGAAAAEQADYGMADSLQNIAFGSVIGGGLHVGAGALGDWLKKGGKSIHSAPPAPGAIPDRLASMSPEEREVTFRIALSQAMSGRVVDVDPLIRPAGFDYAPPSTVSRAATGGLDTADAPIRLGVEPRDTARAERFRQIDALARKKNPQVFSELDRVMAERAKVSTMLDRAKDQASVEVTPEISAAASKLREIDSRLSDIEMELFPDNVDARKIKKLSRQREEMRAEREAAQTQLTDAQAKAGDTTKIAEADKRIRELDREINSQGTGARKAQELGAKRDALIAERDAAIRAVSGDADLAKFGDVRALAGKNADDLAAELKRLDSELKAKTKDAERARRDVERSTGGFYDVDQLKAVAERQSRPESVNLVSREMADAVTAKVTEHLNKIDPVERANVDAAEAEALLRDLETRLGIEPEAPKAGEVNPVAEAETFTRAVQAMATCGIRR